MSYDIRLCDSNGKTLNFPTPHDIGGGTYAVGGTTECWLNVTYNYAPHFYRTMGEKGIRAIYGLTGRESAPILKTAIDQLADDFDDDYWKSTEGNAKLALCGLLVFARLYPDGVWEGD